MNFNPRMAWASTYVLGGGNSSHLKDVKNYSLRMPDGNMTKNEDEKAEVWEPHFNKVFNNKRNVDWSVLDDILQRETMHEHDNDLSRAEFDEALDGLANNKAPGENGVLPDVIKALTGKNRDRLFHWIVEFW